MNNELVFNRVLGLKFLHDNFPYLYNKDRIKLYFVHSKKDLKKLQIPKEHFDNLLYCPKDVLSKVMSVAQKIAQASITTLGAKGVNLVNNTNPIAGQTVMHFHVHVIPRYSDDDQLKLEFNKNLENLNLPIIASNLSENVK